jgi:hypothetical protein
VLFFKALAMCEGMLQTLDPDSNFTDYLQPMALKLIYHAFAGPDLLSRLGIPRQTQQNSSSRCLDASTACLARSNKEICGSGRVWKISTL